jgi:QacR-like protein, C-terminal region
MAKSLPKENKREKTMKRINILTAIFSMSLLVLALPAIASAQYGQSDPYGRNGGYNNGQYDPYSNGQYGNYADMRSTLRDLKSRANQMQRQIDRELDHSRLNGSYREDQVNQLAKNFKSAVNNLDNSYYSRNDNEVRRVMNTASQLDRAIGQARLSYNVMNQWQAIRSDLRTLGINYNSGRGRGNGRNGNGGYGNGGYGKPSWWPF